LLSLQRPLALAAGCNGAPPDEKILTDLCVGIFTGDAQITRLLAADANSDLDAFCACYGATIAADDAKLPLHKDVVGAIAEARTDTSMGAEDAAEAVEEMIRSGEIDTFTEEQLDSTGDDFQMVSELMGENGGQCLA
jgi:hypothetical protein